LFFAGQIAGVEGYMESIAHSIIVARCVLHHLEGEEAPLFPRETLLGSLQRHCIEGPGPFQPMNVNFGILPRIGGRRAERQRLYGQRSLASLGTFLAQRRVPGSA
jgi:methylenetetrahydrofolate--tRNA-(uracil-5-)-methyltransferase